MIDLTHVTHLAFDADDTLWANENIFVDAKKTAEQILASYLGSETIEAQLDGFERRNLDIFGYGIKGFTLSLIETAIQMSDRRVTASEIEQIVELSKEMLKHPVHLLPGVEEAIDRLEDRFTLAVITKGDLFDQENKLARSGIADRFDLVEIVTEKDVATYTGICRRHAIEPRQLLMLGNSVKSDILPVLEIGGQAIHIPYEHTWSHEQAEASEVEFPTVEDMAAAVAMIEAAS